MQLKPRIPSFKTHANRGGGTANWGVSNISTSSTVFNPSTSETGLFCVASLST